MNIMKKMFEKEKKTFIYSEQKYQEFLNKKIKLEEGETDYIVFYNGIQNLVEEGLIKGVKASGYNSMNPKLFNKYKKVIKKEDNSDLVMEIQTKFNTKLNMHYYLKNIEDYKKDKEKLILLSNFLDSKKNNLEIISLNERSYEIFSDEKYLSQDGKRIINNTSIKLEELNCYNTYEPFFYFNFNNVKESKVLIIENKDTFYSIKKLLLENKNKWSGIEIDVLIYGEGNKIVQSIEFLNEIQEFRASEIYYFGDLDYEGINIYYRLLKVKNDIKLFNYFYEKLIDYNYEKSRKIPKKQIRNKENEILFLSNFDENYKKKIFEIFENGKYIPQEGLNKKILFEI